MRSKITPLSVIVPSGIIGTTHMKPMTATIPQMMPNVVGCQVISIAAARIIAALPTANPRRPARLTKTEQARFELNMLGDRRLPKRVNRVNLIMRRPLPVFTD
jgi:hypothetical protein